MTESNKRKKTKAIIEKAMVDLLHQESFDHITTVELALLIALNHIIFILVVGIKATATDTSSSGQFDCCNMVKRLLMQ